MTTTPEPAGNTTHLSLPHIEPVGSAPAGLGAVEEGRKMKSSVQPLNVGTRMYNLGDRANPDHFGTITQVKVDDWGIQYRITPDPDSNYTFGPYWVNSVMVSDEFLGNGTTRIVTEAEHKRWSDARIAAYKAKLAKAEGRSL